MEGMDDNGSGYEAGSENTLPPSSPEISVSDDHKKKKPCEVCGCNADDKEIMTCFKCEDTREHRYCAKVWLGSVPDMWLCETCRSSSRVVVIGRESKETANSGPNHADNDQDSAETAAPRSNHVDNQNTLSEISVTNQSLQAQARRVASSPVRDQKQSDSSMPSDSESAI